MAIVIPKMHSCLWTDDSLNTMMGISMVLPISRITISVLLLLQIK